MRHRLSKSLKFLVFPAAVCASGVDATATNPTEITFAHAIKGPWTLAAMTTVAGSDDKYPTVQEIKCSIEKNGLRVSQTRSGRFHVEIRGTSQSGVDHKDFGVLNITRVVIGSAVYAAKGIEFGHANRNFSDVSYPNAEAGSIITSSFIGYMATQRGEHSPWLNVDTLLDEMIIAPSMTVSYRVSNDDAANSWRLEKSVISLKGLGDAIKWCQVELVSPAALRFHSTNR